VKTGVGENSASRGSDTMDNDAGNVLGAMGQRDPNVKLVNLVRGDELALQASHPHYKLGIHEIFRRRRFIRG
jgi:hypothetical protein